MAPLWASAFSSASCIQDPISFQFHSGFTFTFRCVINGHDTVNNVYASKDLKIKLKLNLLMYDYAVNNYTEYMTFTKGLCKLLMSYHTSAKKKINIQAYIVILPNKL